MKKILILLLFPMWLSCGRNGQHSVETPQTSEADVAVAVEQLIKGMTAADESLLQSITADELIYGHSSGKVQNKNEFIAEILSGQPLVYLRIEPLDQTIQMTGDVAIVRHIFTADTRNIDNELGSLRVGNMLVWHWQDGKWKLLARQAYRL